MGALSSIILILLSLLTYSAGKVGRERNSDEVKTKIFDLIILILIWSLGIYAGTRFDLKRWVLLLIFTIISFFLGLLTTSFRKKEKTQRNASHIQKKNSQNISSSLWNSGKRFFKRVGVFQTRIILSFFYFIFVSPLALGVKLLSDPLKIKQHKEISFWSKRREKRNDFDEFRRQF